MYSLFWSCTSERSGLSHSIDPGQLHRSPSLKSNAWFSPPSGSAFVKSNPGDLEPRSRPRSQSTSSVHMVPGWGQQHMAADFEVHLFISSLILTSCSLKSSSFTSVSRLCQEKGKPLNPSCSRAPHGWAGLNDTKVLMGWPQYPLCEVSLPHTAKGWLSLPSQSRVETSAHSSARYTLAFTF